MLDYFLIPVLFLWFFFESFTEIRSHDSGELRLDFFDGHITVKSIIAECKVSEK
jgi:hypothetical protein